MGSEKLFNNSKHYFIPEIIEKRRPLAETARRAGWIGCNIDLTKIPDSGRIYLVKNSEIIAKEKVCKKWQKTSFLKHKKGISKGWILDVMNCVDAIEKDTFSLKEIYQFEQALKVKYPYNNFVRDKIRQQLQFLRDKGLIEFKGNGVYKKIIMSEKKFKVEIQEFLSKTIEIDAKNIDEAILKVKKMYHNEEIVLNNDNYINTEIKECK